MLKEPYTGAETEIIKIDPVIETVISSPTTDPDNPGDDLPPAPVNY